MTAKTKSANKRAAREAARKKAQRRQRVATAVGGVAVVGFLALAVWAFSPANEPDGVTDATAWDLPALDGDGRVALTDFRGRPTVAAFFAAWCHVCVWELPEFAEVSVQLGDQVNFVGIDMMDHGTGLGLAQRTGIAGLWPLARDVGQGDGRGLASEFAATGSPMTVVYDAEGAVVEVVRGGMRGDQLLELLAERFGIET